MQCIPSRETQKNTIILLYWSIIKIKRITLGIILKLHFPFLVLDFTNARTQPLQGKTLLWPHQNFGQRLHNPLQLLLQPVPMNFQRFLLFPARLISSIEHTEAATIMSDGHVLMIAIFKPWWSPSHSSKTKSYNDWWNHQCEICEYIY